MYSKREGKYTLENAEEEFKRSYSDRINDMTKIKLKCWIAYCRYAKREENKEEAMDFHVYCNIVCPDTYIGHIKSGEINCEDIGGKDKAVEVVKKWFNIKEEK